MRAYPEDSALYGKHWPMTEAWLRAHNRFAGPLSPDCVHDLLTNCAWWEGKMEETYKTYKDYSRGNCGRIRNDVVEGNNGYRAVDN